MVRSRQVLLAACLGLVGCNAILGNEEGVLVGPGDNGPGGTAGAGATGATAGNGAAAGDSSMGGAAAGHGGTIGVGGEGDTAGAGGADAGACEEGALGCNGKTRQECVEGNWVRAQMQCGAGQICTGAGLCATHRLTGGVTAVGEYVAAPSPAWRIKDQTLSHSPRVCGNTHCVSGGIAP